VAGLRRRGPSGSQRLRCAAAKRASPRRCDNLRMVRTAPTALFQPASPGPKARAASGGSGPRLKDGIS